MHGANTYIFAARKIRSGRWAVDKLLQADHSLVATVVPEMSMSQPTAITIAEALRGAYWAGRQQEMNG